MNLKSALILSALGIAGAANAVTLAAWNFDTTTVSSTASQNLAAIAANTGTGSATARHAAATTVYSTPAGNGSAKSLSSNGWASGDYYQFTTSATGFNGLSISFDVTGSNTGPRDFALTYSTNGTTFTSAGAYTLTNDAWAGTGDPKAVSAKSFNLSGVTSLDNQATVTFRLTNNSTASISGATTATAGTSRVDNVVISGTQAVPEPASMAALGLGAVAMLRRRRSAK